MKKRFNFKKYIKRNDFTIVFGGFGKRRFLKDFVSKPNRLVLRFKIQKIRRAKQGWRNKVFGMIHALRIRKTYGRRKPIGSFRR
jgi:hypothetical protein